MKDFDITEILKGIDKLANDHQKLLDVCKKAIDSNSLTILIDYLHNGGTNE